MRPAPCPCGSGESYAACCGRYLDAGEQAATAQILMRSRYTAFVRGDEAYLLRTWHPDSRPPRIAFDSRQKWLGLDIVAVHRGGLFDREATVEFVAHYALASARLQQHETSLFEREDGSWLYRGPVS